MSRASARLDVSFFFFPFFFSNRRKADATYSSCDSSSPSPFRTVHTEQVHEEFWRGTLAEAAEAFTHRTPRGEITLVVAGVGPDGGFGEGDVAAGGAGALSLSLIHI